MKNMKLKIKNFGPINEAEIDIGKITVIAGPNASGKTTSSKLFYSLIASSSSDGEYLANRGIIKRMISLLYSLSLHTNQDPTESDELIKLSAELNDTASMYNMPGISVREVYNDMLEIFKELKIKNIETFKEELDQIDELLKIKDDKNAIYDSILFSLLEMEFDGPEQIRENFTNSTVEFYGENDDCQFRNCIITKNDVSEVKISNDYLDCFKVNEVSYIETPYIFDFTLALDFDLPSRSSSKYHQKLLMRKLRDSLSKEDVYDKVVNKKTINFQKKIDEIIEGKFKFDKNSRDFKFEKDGKTFTIKNTASGLKQIGIIQLLLENRKLPENSYLIMDEPEVHLHPELQIKLAEILVCLSKELKVNIYINSHSPHFIEAMEVYSQYYKMSEGTNFYLTVESGNNKFDFRKINRKNIGAVYNCLGKPYDVLNEIRGKNDAFDVIADR
jgi:predicted ATPase